jgi:hypothetical protein
VNRIRARFGPLWPYIVLTAIPAAAFILPDLIGGHLLMSGDNVQQNYPLHVLVGSMLRHGQLPFWNQFIFSGSPLLADFNAGAFYPLMGLFVILPDRVAWIATEVILFSAIAIGMYTFLRTLALSTMACFLAAATFAFSGTVLSQVNHVDMTEGFLAIPWMLLAVLHIIRDGRWRWSALLGVGFATVILGGAPEAMLDEAILIMAYAAVSAGLDRGRWWRVLTRGGAGAALALSLAAIQWLPGLNAIANSQRSGAGGGFASSGSYPRPFGFLSLVPYLYGGYGHLGERSFFSHYNLPEVGIYLGILPMVALVTLLHPRWPSRLPGRERFTWYVVGLLGLLLALGSNTPLEPFFNSLPLYGHQRLQSRNMIDVAVALCVLFAGWIDRAPEADRTLRAYDRMAALAPLGVVAGLATWAIADPASLLRTLAGASAAPSYVRTVREATIIALVFCATAATIVWLRTRLPARWWLSAVTVFVAVDLGLIAVTSQLASFPSNAALAGQTPEEQFLAAHLAPGGRFDVYDPQGYAPSRSAIGLPDLNILARLPSVAGYASIVNNNYSTLTQTHNLGELNIAELRAGALDRLDLQDIVTVPEYFLVPLRQAPSTLAEVRQLPESHGDDPVLPLGNGADYNDTHYPFYPGARPALRSGATSGWFFGESIDPGSASLLFTTATAAASAVRFGKVGTSGTTVWGPVVPVAGGVTSVTGDLPPGKAVGLSLEVLSGGLPDHQGIVAVGTRTFELDGSLSSAIQPGTWRQGGVVQDFTLFVRLRPPTPIFAVSGNGESTLRVIVLSSSTKYETIRVHVTKPSTIVRDVAWDPGWSASVAVDGGLPRDVPVKDQGLVQQVRIPTGTDVVTFRYLPQHIVAASMLSLGGVVVLIALLVVTLVRRRTRRAHGGRGGSALVS